MSTISALERDSYLTPNTPAFGAVFNVDEIKRANRQSGSHFFDADTMQFFGSRVLDGVSGGRFFVTSEKSGFDDPTRTYTVREFMPDGSIETLGEFNGHATTSRAKRAIREASKQTHAYYFEGQHGAAGRKATYVVADAIDPWQALGSLHRNFRVFHCGRAKDWMLEGDSADHYPKIKAKG